MHTDIHTKTRRGMHGTTLDTFLATAFGACVDMMRMYNPGITVRSFPKMFRTLPSCSQSLWSVRDTIILDEIIRGASRRNLATAEEWAIMRGLARQKSQMATSMFR